MPGHYVLAHSVAGNAFQNVPTTPLYTAKYKDFLVDKNVRLICGWSKEMDLNHLSVDQILKKRLNPKYCWLVLTSRFHFMVWQTNPDIICSF